MWFGLAERQLWDALRFYEYASYYGRWEQWRGSNSDPNAFPNIKY